METTIKHYQKYSLSRAYSGKTFYWGLQPEVGDFICFKFDEPMALSGFKFVSGNAEHPLDKFQETAIAIMPNDPDIDLTILDLNKTIEGYYVVGFLTKLM